MTLDDVAVERLGKTAVRTCDDSFKLELRDSLGGGGFEVVVRDLECLRHKCPANFGLDSRSRDGHVELGINLGWLSCLIDALADNLVDN